MKRRLQLRWFWNASAALALLYVIHLLPESAAPPPAGAGKTQFQWKRDDYWRELQARFERLRAGEHERIARDIGSSLASLQRILDFLAATNLPPQAVELDALETNFLELAPGIAACPERLPDYLAAFGEMRTRVKRQSEQWPIGSGPARERLYRLLYGGRAAIEEVMLQAPRDRVPPLLPGVDEVSATPAAEVHGVTLHSGDLLLSRGGAATSALIARGNDFTGNFSHVALVHVDEATHAVSVVESHIESGVGVFPIAQYLQQAKLRIMVLRPRADLPQLVEDPMLPHKAALHAAREAARRHIPYDFAMDHDDPSKQFCSEVASAAYKAFGVNLWMGMSHLSTPGVTAWLSSLGVRHFETQEPSDLEYDPQLSVVAEWRDPETLLKDHVDNAVIDAMLEGAEAGEPLEYNRWMLPVARGLKAWSVVKNRLGAVGPVPEGMSATVALRVDRLTQRHEQIANGVMARVDQFRSDFDYMPPFWELLQMAREARDE